LNTKVGNFLSKRIAILMISIVVAISGALFFTLSYVNSAFERVIAAQTAESYAKILSGTQAFYSKQIVTKAVASGIQLRAGLQDKEGAIPVPATFMHELVDDLNAKYPQYNLRFYSDYPFFERASNSTLDQFEREALGKLRQSGDASISKIEWKDGVARLRYAKAIKMEQSCVDCHNSHIDSPRTDWKLGEVRGAQSLTILLGQVSVWAWDTVNPMVYVVLGSFVSVTIFLAALLYTTHKFHEKKRQNQTTEEKNRQLQLASDQINSLVFVNPVTNLPNRRSFNERVREIAAVPHDNITHCSVILFDLDHFKNVNDSYGHEIGDLYLERIGQRTRSFFGDTGFVSHLSGDEFAVLLTHDERTEFEWGQICEPFIENIIRPIVVNSLQIYPSVSIGVAQCRIGDTELDTLLVNSGLALQNCKQNIRGRYRVYNSELRRMSLRSTRLEEKLRIALKEDVLEVHYQPKVDLNTGQVNGLEALVRWPDSAEGFVPPLEFLQVAEDYGFIHPVSDYIFKRVALDIASWKSNGHKVPNVSINVHSAQLKTPKELYDSLGHFTDNNVVSKDITLEITEGCFMGRGTEHVADILRQLSESGYRISLDDFGTGFASLLHLKFLQVDEIKIDRSFVADVLENHESRTIVEAMIRIADGIGADAVAEGLETSAQVLKLTELGCNSGQGYYFMPALRPQAISALLSSENAFHDKIDRKMMMLVQDTELTAS